MEKRIVDFIAALRATGVRVSVAESGDAFQAVENLGVSDREAFRMALRTTLVKEHDDQPTFDYLFPLFFGTGEPPMNQPQEGMSAEEQEMLREALRQMLGKLAQLLHQLAEGRPLSREELEQLGQQAGLPFADQPYHQHWMSQRMMRQLGLGQLAEALQELLEQLAEMGMSGEALQQLAEEMHGNAESLAEQISQYVGMTLAQQRSEEYQQHPPSEADLMEQPLQNLSEAEAEQLRRYVTRLAAQLRSRAALRQKRGKTGTLDSKATIRASLRYGGVPIEIRHKTRHLKPKVVLICDVSTSMRPVAEFMLRLMYELQDQIARARSFAFIDDLTDISEYFEEHRPEAAVRRVLGELRPGHYNTDLGHSLNTFTQKYLGLVDHRTTFIVLGDGRNNFNDPRLDAFNSIKRHARRMIWLNPEPQGLWGTGDSDIYEYVPLCDAVHQVSNLAELAAAIDRLLAPR